MKRILTTLLLVVMVAPLIGCQKESKSSDSNSRVRYRGARGAPELGYNRNYNDPFYNPGIPRPDQGYYGRQFSPRDGKPWGTIYGGSILSDTQFNYNIQDFLAPAMDPMDVGYVSSSANDSTGVRFWGYIEPSRGYFNPNGMSQTTIRSNNSELRLTIWDEYTGSIDASGDLVTDIPWHAKGRAEGEIAGNTARIRFIKEGVGWVELYGSFDAQYFSGTVWFDNNRGYANYLGAFYISTCSFFRCN